MVTIRPIIQSDDDAMASIIFRSLEEYDLALPGTVYTDETTHHLSTLFNEPSSAYFVAEMDGVIAGGCGVFPTPDLTAHTAELVKMYVAKDYRGRKIGESLLSHAMNAAMALGYRRLYLESFPALKQAIALYEKFGFRAIAQREGNSCHHACNVFMEKILEG